MCADKPQDQARNLLNRARKAAPARVRRPRRLPADEQPWSGSGPDPRDPQTVGAVVGDLVRDRNWESTLRSAGIPARWAQLVGPEMAEHCRPVRLDAGRLTCVAESTAWATQIQLLSRQLLERLGVELGAGVVTSLHVQGPSAPDWRHGPLRVTGRGPRDTYG
ncbi:MAG TPA: DciA family protein [Amycolatopsis sp.]|nr:DciA family protein [Amycolatopsis sp.]